MTYFISRKRRSIPGRENNGPFEWETQNLGYTREKKYVNTLRIFGLDK